jgi:hypothetical protein
VEALPPYKPGSQDKVTKALADFKGALPGQNHAARRGSGTSSSTRPATSAASLEVQQGQYEAVKKAGEQLDAVEEALRKIAKPDVGAYGVVTRGYDSRFLGKLSDDQKRALDHDEIPVGTVVDIAKSHGLTQLSSQDVLDIIKRAGLKPYKE